MKYTKNITNKLKQLDFVLELDSNHLPPEACDDNLHYEIWRKGVVEVTVEHSPGKLVQVDLVANDCSLNIKTIEELDTLTKLLTVKKQKYE